MGIYEVRISQSFSCMNECLSIVRYLEATQCFKIKIEDWDSPLPFDEAVTSEYFRIGQLENTVIGVSWNSTFFSPSESTSMEAIPMLCPVRSRRASAKTLDASTDQHVNNSVMAKSGRHRVLVGRSPISSKVRNTKLKQRKKVQIDSRLSTPRSIVHVEEENNTADGNKQIEFSCVDKAVRRPQRRIQFDRKVKKGMMASLIHIPDVASMDETWTLYVYSPGCIIVEIRSKAREIPFADYFIVVTR